MGRIIWTRLQILKIQNYNLKLNNYLIQGSAADIIKSVIIEVDNFLRKHHYKTKLQGCIHDELCICVAEGEHDVIYKIKKIMETTVKTYVPLVAEISVSKTNWAEKKGEQYGIHDTTRNLVKTFKLLLEKDVFSKI